MTDDVSLSIAQVDGAWRLMCAGAPRFITAESNGVQYIFSRLPISFFNIALLTGSGLSAEALSARGREACAWAADKDVPWLLMVTHERLQPGVDAAAVLDACGLAAIMPMTGMLAQTVAAAPPIPDLLLTEPQDDESCAAITDINAIAYQNGSGGPQRGRSVPGPSGRTSSRFSACRTESRSAAPQDALMMNSERYVAFVADESQRQQHQLFTGATCGRPWRCREGPRRIPDHPPCSPMPARNQSTSVYGIRDRPDAARS